MLVPVNSQDRSLSDPRDRRAGWQMGEVLSAGARAPFRLLEDDLTVHSCVLGQSGSGKSKFLELLMRYLMVHGQGGFCLIDPHGDLSEDLLAFVQYRRVVKSDKALLPRIHYLEPSYEQVFHWDPFKFRPVRPIPEYHREAAHRLWLHTRADRIGEIVQRKQGASDFAGMARLQRHLTNVLTAVGTPVDRDGKHLGLADALVVLDVAHKRHGKVFQAIEKHLDPDILADLRRLKALPRQEERDRLTESTVNRLRSLLSPLVKSIFTDHVETLDFRSIVQNGEILLVNLRETDYFSADQASAIGGMFIHEVLATAQNTPREMRKRFHLIVDEAGEFIGADIQRALGVMRKFEMPICLAAQDLSSFKKGPDLDLRPKVLSQCGTVVSFRQTWPDDLDILARVIGMGNVDFQKHYQIVDRPDGYDFIDTVTYTDNFAWQEGWSNGFAQTRSEGETDTTGRTVSDGRSESRGKNWQDTRGQADTTSQSKTLGPLGVKLTTTEGSSQAKNQGRSAGGSEARADTHTVANQSSHATTRQESEQVSEGKSGSKGGGNAVSRGKQALAKTREERHETPSLLDSVNDQIEKMKQQIHGFGVGEAVCRLRHFPQAFAFRTAHVDEKWLPGDKGGEVEKVKKALTLIRGYLSPPQLDAAAQERRLDALLAPPADGASPREAGAPDVGARRTGDVFAPPPGKKNPFPDTENP